MNWEDEFSFEAHQSRRSLTKDVIRKFDLMPILQHLTVNP